MLNIWQDKRELKMRTIIAYFPKVFILDSRWAAFGNKKLVEFKLLILNLICVDRIWQTKKTYFH